MWSLVRKIHTAETGAVIFSKVFRNHVFSIKVDMWLISLIHQEICWNKPASTWITNRLEPATLHVERRGHLSITFIPKMLDHVFLEVFLEVLLALSELQEELVAALAHRQGIARNKSKCHVQTKVGSFRYFFFLKLPSPEHWQVTYSEYFEKTLPIAGSN